MSAIWPKSVSYSWKFPNAVKKLRTSSRKLFPSFDYNHFTSETGGYKTLTEKSFKTKNDTDLLHPQFQYKNEKLDSNFVYVTFQFL